MSRARTICWLRACLLGLFVCAQVFGVVPTIYEHTLNVYETVPLATHNHSHTNHTAPDADHHHGITALEDQCCTLHLLAGPLPNGASVAQAVSEGAPLSLPEIATLICVAPHRLDRPPKALSLV